MACLWVTVSCLDCAGMGPVYLQISSGSKPQVDELVKAGRCCKRVEHSFRKLCVVLTEAHGPNEVQRVGLEENFVCKEVLQGGEQDS